MRLTTAPITALAAVTVVLGLVAPATSVAAEPDTRASSGGLSSPEAARSVVQDGSGRGPGSSEAQPVAVAVVEQPDGSLAVETYPAGSVSSAARVAGELARQDGVVAAGLDHRVSALATVTPEDDTYFGEQWALQALKAPSAWSRSTGAGVVVAVVDTGVLRDHEDLSGRVLEGIDLTDTAAEDDDDGHGTHVAGIIAASDNATGVVGLAPGATILPVRVLDADGGGYLSDVADGIIWAAGHGADVINLSLGGEDDSPVLRSAVNYAMAKGSLVVAAAGNDYKYGNPTNYPAAIPGVLAVGATNDQGAVATFSERKSYVGVAAPGVGIVSTYPYDDYEWMSGTSMATPFVSAAAALLLEKQPTLSPAALGAYLTGTATDAGFPGRDPAYGFGHLNPDLALDRVISRTSRPTSLSIASSASRVTANASVKLTSVFASNGWRLARRPVQFQQYAGGRWTTIEPAATTNGSGVATYTLPVRRNTRFRAVVAAAPGLAAAVSTSTIVAVSAKVAIKGSSPSANRVTVSAKVWPHQAVTAKLQRKVEGVWRTISTKTTSSTGTVTFKKRAPSGKRKFRVVVRTTTLAGQGASGALTITVK